MFKLVVLCAFFAAAAAKPDILIPAPITQYSTVLTPASTTITKQENSVIHPSPLLHQAPLFYQAPIHFIKKRSPQFPLAYAAYASYYPNYLAATTYNAPLFHGAPVLPAPITPIASVPTVHLIKKRSAPLIPIHSATTYAATAPLLASTYTATAPIYTTAYHTPLISQPIAYTHLIKKRSAPLFTTYPLPTSYAHQSRFDLRTTYAPYTAISYAAPFAATSPFAVPHLY